MAAQSQRALRIMIKTQHEQRSSVRRMLHRSAKITCPGAKCVDQIAMIRDVSEGGIFFYSKLRATPGTELTLVFNMPVAGRHYNVIFKGTVVRVERCPEGALTGIAAKLDLGLEPMMTNVIPGNA